MKIRNNKEMKIKFISGISSGKADFITKEGTKLPIFTWNPVTEATYYKVSINKMDKEGANPEKIKEQLEDIEIDEGKRGEKVALVRGRDIETGLPRSLRVTESEIREAISPVISEIVDSVMDVIEETPPVLTSDILEHGILLTGGGSLLPGVDDLIIDKTKIPVTLIEDPLTTVVRGCAKLLNDPETLNRVKVTGGLR